MTETLDHKKTRLQKLLEGNERAYAEMQQATGGRMNIDFDSARREMFIDSLVTWGVITEEQKVDFDLAFHEQVEQAIKQGWADIREQQRQAAQPKLVVPSQRPVRLVDPKTGKPIGS
jgi:hypothetical protein